MAADGSLVEVLRGLEEELLDGAVRQDGVRLGEMLAAEFLEFGSSGRVYTRAETIAALRVEMPARLSLREFRAMRLSEDVVHVTYRSVRDEEHHALRSSLWIFRAGRWQMLFHQGTRMPVIN